MSIISNYKNFKQNQPKYKSWKEERDLNLQKKIKYINSHKDEFSNYQDDIQRAKVVLDAVNVMDEYSQTKAENMEQITQTVTMPIMQLASYLSMGIGGAITALNKKSRIAIQEVFSGNFKNIKHLIPGVAAMLSVLCISVGAISAWSASKEVKASRMGRTESMMDDLSSPNRFAILTKTQQKEQEKIADTIKVDKKEAKKIIAQNNGFGIVSSIKMLIHPDKEVSAKLNEFSKKINEEIKNVDNVKLSKEEELQAKKDQELIQTIVEKIDIASQDYAEDAELATSVVSAALGFFGVGSYAGLNAILSKVKSIAKYSPIISGVLAMTGFIAGTVTFTKIQKQASRVARFKVRNELLDNPQALIYVDPEKYKDVKITPENKKKSGYFTKLINLFKDNKEYNEYIKKNNARDIQLRKAKDKLNLSQEQLENATQLQNNVFKMFNKLDEKSQSYAESTEALGDVAISLSGLLAGLATTGIIIKNSAKMTKFTPITILKAFIPLFSAILLNVLVTKEQKNASKVADMEAINELSDFRHFANNKKEINSKENNTQENEKTISPMLEKMLKQTI